MQTEFLQEIVVKSIAAYLPSLCEYGFTNTYKAYQKLKQGERQGIASKRNVARKTSGRSKRP